MTKKKKTVKAWAVKDGHEEKTFGNVGIFLYKTRGEMFEDYNVHTPKEWKENVGWDYFPCTITYEI